jgi:hypothetical protein
MAETRGVEVGPDEPQTLDLHPRQNLVNGSGTAGRHEESSAALEELNTPASMYAVLDAGRPPGGPQWQGDAGCLTNIAGSGARWVVSLDGWPDVLCE